MFGTYESKSLIDVFRAEPVHEPLRSTIPAPKELQGIAPETSRFSLEIRKKNILFEGCTLKQGQWIGSILRAIDVPLQGVDRVVLQATGDSIGVAQYIAESHSLIIYGGLLREAADNDIRRAQSQPRWQKKPDSGKYLLAYALVHEVAGHSRDANLHMRVGKDPKTGKLVAELPPEFNGVYGEDFVATLDAENQAILQLCERSIRTGVYLNTGKSNYHRIVCDAFRDALARQRLEEVNSEYVFRAYATMVLETKAILVEMRFRGRRHLKTIDKVQVQKIAFEEQISEEQVRANGFMPALTLADRVVAQSIGQNVERFGTDRKNVEAHTLVFRSRLFFVSRNPFQFADSGEGK
jgi:hypothetical protein